MAKIEIQGLERLKGMLNGLRAEMRPAVLREIARKPATKAAGIARNLQPIGATGATARTIGIMKVKNAKWTFVEVGYRGRSLGNIYLSAPTITRQNRGTIKGFPWLFKRAGENLMTSGKIELKTDMSKFMGRIMRRHGYRPRI